MTDNPLESLTNYSRFVAEWLYWYDDFPHPQDAGLASTFPHHKHVPPDIKHHRVPAPEISFTQPNLPVLISEIVRLEEV